MDEKAHYIILRQGTHVISKHHESYISAVEEASRLTRKEHDVFVIYKSISKVAIDEVPIAIVNYAETESLF